ncbi:MAG: BACON domain-containing carbohydrate-binding protein [Melioribacteraceae bacterium]
MSFSNRIVVKYFLSFVLIATLTFQSNLFSQNDGSSKQGGICFRTDDNQPLDKYLQYGNLFTNYSQKFTLAINFGRAEINPTYIAGLKTLQDNGHEIMDHTPGHRTNFFNTLFPDFYVGHPGVYNIIGTKIELNHKPVKTSEAVRSGTVDIDGNTITSSSGEFANFDKSECYLYFPSIDQLIYISQWVDDNTITAGDFWWNSIDLGSYSNIEYYNFSYHDVHLTKGGIKALAQESIKLMEHYELERPYTWIQPGGFHPHIERKELAQALFEVGYTSAGIFPNPSLKVFNEYNPNNDKQFGIDFGDFRDDIWTLEHNKKYIADRIAKHHVIVGHSHFAYGELLGGWDGFLTRTEGLIQWCVDKNIPIKTYKEWADVLYVQTLDPLENIFPNLNVDLNEDGYPDGFNNLDINNLDVSDGANDNDNYSISIDSEGELCSINDLGGVEKGEVNFSVWTKGASGNFIEVTVSGHGDLINTFKFPAENSNWTKYNLSQSVNGNTSLNIEEYISLIDVDITCSNYSSGSVKISEMKMFKSSSVEDYLSVSPNEFNVESNSSSSSFSISSNVSWQITEDVDWLSTGTTSGNGNSNILVTSDENTEDISRTGIITISDGTISRNVTVNQEAQIELVVTPLDSTVSYDEGSFNIYINSNSSWNVDKNIEWISVSKSEGSDDDILLANYTKNNSSEERNGFIYIYNTNLDTSTISIIQAGLPVYSIVASVDSAEAGTVIGFGNFLLGDTVKVIATPKQGWEFISWKEDGTSISNEATYTFVANVERTLLATFHSNITNIEKLNVLPEDFSLSQNYPNPFNPTTTISFSIATNSNVKLDIFNSTGQLVKNLINQNLASGKYTSVWSGENNLGVKVNSGIYFYRITASNFTETKSMILMK